MRLLYLLSCLLCVVVSVSGYPNPYYQKGVGLAQQGNIEEATLLFETYLAHEPEGKVSYPIIDAHNWLAGFDERKGELQKAIDRYYHILELVEETNKLGLYGFKVHYPNNKINYMNGVFHCEWARGRLGHCAEIYSKAKPACNELMEVADPIKDRPMWQYLMSRQINGKWAVDHMEIYLLIAAGKQQEVIDKHTELIQNIEQYAKVVSLSEGNKRMFQNMCAIQANEYSEIGKFDEALDNINRASTIHFAQNEFLNSTTAVLGLKASVIRAKRDGVPTIDRLAIRDAWKIIDKSNRPIDKIAAKRCIAEVLQLSENPTEALPYINDAVKIARETNYSQFMPETLRLRASINFELGNSSLPAFQQAIPSSGYSVRHYGSAPPTRGTCGCMEGMGASTGAFDKIS